MFKKAFAIITAATIACSILGLTGCSSDATEQKILNCVVAYSQRMNSSASPSLAEAEIAKTVESHGYLDVVRIDGSPTSAANTGATMGSDDANKTNREYEEQTQLYNALGLINGTCANTEEADIIAAIELANRSLANARGTGINTVVVCDSGISTAGLLNFTEEGMLSADPSSFVTYLESHSLMPRFEHIDRIVWYGFGDVSDTQEKMPLNVSDNVKAMYKEVLNGAGVSEVVFMDDISQNPSEPSGNLPKVSTVTMPKTPSFTGAGSAVKLDQSQLSFKGDSDEFIDEASARSTLGQYADALSKDRSLTARVEGYTASYPSDPTWPERLSSMRAERVKKTLCELGANESQIKAQGCGVGPVSDLDKNGLQIEKLSAQNRYVLISFE